MRPPGMIVVAAVLAVGNARGQEPGPSRARVEAADIPAASVSPSLNVEREGFSPGSRFAIWRPIGRWLSRTSAPQAPVAIVASVDPNQAIASQPFAGQPSPDQPALDPIPAQPAPGVGGFSPSVPGVNPFETDAGATPPGAGGPTPATAGGTQAQNPGSVPITSNPAATNIIAGTGALGRVLGIDEESGIRLGGIWIGDTSGIALRGKESGGLGLEQPRGR